MADTGLKKLTKEEWLAAYDAHKGNKAAAQRAFGDRRIRDGTWRRWAEDVVFNDQYRAIQQKWKTNPQGPVFDPDRPTPPKGSFAEWRPKYTGRVVLPSQELFVNAYEDRSNRIIIWKAPTGSGKDTTVGDLLNYELCDDKDGLRIAWIMESMPLARRRLAERVALYFTDPKIHQFTPDGHESVKPAGSLVDDYGPFKYEKGMTYPDGSPVPPTTWTKNEMYLLRAEAPEQDPNLWATGMQSKLYGSRVGLMVFSDLFTKENQRSPIAMDDQFGWITGTALSRLDSRGRLIVINTRVKDGDNIERLEVEFTKDARVVHSEPGYVKYSNGVAVVTSKAITHNADGEEISFWESKFPLRSHLETIEGVRYPVDELTDDEILELGATGAVMVEGLVEQRARDPITFETIQQQSPPKSISGDFTDAVMALADDEERTYEVVRSGELLVVGVDPARKSGAAYVVWAVDRKAHTITVVDEFYGENLGIQGIKQNLIIKPCAMWQPSFLMYEINKHEAVLDDPTIIQAVKDLGVTMLPHQTHVGNRATGDLSVPSLALHMRMRTIRWPTMTAEDRRRTTRIKDHFSNWDAASYDTRTKSSRGGHRPDDLAMAAWIGFIKAYEILEKGQRFRNVRNFAPPAVRRKWLNNQIRNGQIEEPSMRHTPPTNQEVVSMILGGANAPDTD